MQNLYTKEKIVGKKAPSPKAINPALDKHVIINSRPVRFGSFSPLFEKKGINGFHFDYSTSGIHRSNYVVGRYMGNDIGIRFGRMPWLYEREAEALEKFSHPGMPKCHGIGHLQTNAGDFGYMLLQHFPGTVLSKAVDFSSREGTKKSIGILSSIVDTIDYMHSMGVVHQDITSDHVLVHKKGISFIDFHLWDSTDTRHPIADFCGSEIPPSIIESVLSSGPLGTKKQAEWEPRGYGRMLKAIIPPDIKSDLLNCLRGLADRLTKKSGNPADAESREAVSAEIRQTLSSLTLD
ncbi:MAG: protein kinase [Candidatus Micrarchaeota archaeon]|nr:protein kinase [Candidatus Micrarchaeota archaeon]